MGNLSSTKEKNIVNCGSVFLKKQFSINEINKSFPYEVCTIQDLYDATNLKNGTNIDLAADLINKTENIKIVLTENSEFKDLSIKFCESLRALGLNAERCNLKEGIILENSNVLMMLDFDLRCKYLKKFFNKSTNKSVKIINILSEKHENEKNDAELNLYHLDWFNFSKALCVEILLKSVYLGILTKCYTQ